MARTGFVFTFRLEGIANVNQLPNNLEQVLESVLQRASLDSVKNEIERNSGITCSVSRFAASSAPLTARCDIEFEAELFSDLSFAETQDKLTDIRLIIGQYLAYVLRLELHKRDLGEAVGLKVDHGFVHSEGLRWKEQPLWWNWIAFGGPAFAVGMLVAGGVTYYVMNSPN